MERVGILVGRLEPLARLETDSVEHHQQIGCKHTTRYSALPGMAVLCRNSADAAGNDRALVKHRGSRGCMTRHRGCRCSLINIQRD